MKITRRQLRILIEQYVVDSSGVVTPPQQYFKDAFDMFEAVNLEQVLMDVYYDAFKYVADRQYQIYKASKLRMEQEKLERLRTLFNSEDGETFRQALDFASTLGLFSDDYEAISNLLKNSMLGDSRLEDVKYEILDYLDRAAMSDLIYVDDKGYKPYEFMDVIVDYLVGYDDERDETGDWPIGLARGLKRLILNPGSWVDGRKGLFFLERLGLEHLATDRQQNLPKSMARHRHPAPAFYPFAYRLNLYDVFPNAKEMTIGYPASREGKEEYGLGHSVDTIVFIHCSIYCGHETADTSNYFNEYLGELLSDYGLRLLHEDGGTQIVMGSKRYFDEAIADVNKRFPTIFPGYPKLPAGDYELLISAFLHEADDMYSNGGYNSPCDSSGDVMDIYEFPGYEREAKKEISDILYNSRHAQSILSDLRNQDPETARRVVDIIIAHMNDDMSAPEWDYERSLPELVAAASAENKLSGGRAGDVHDQLAAVLDYDFASILEDLVFRVVEGE